MKKNDEGFTLIELLIVIVILGILAAVVVFAVGGITDQGQTSSCKAEKKTLEVAVEAYRAQEGGYPGSLSDVAAFTRSTPTLYNVGSGGTITASGSTCSGI
jgi:general secretion pathway protein G